MAGLLACEGWYTTAMTSTSIGFSGFSNDPYDAIAEWYDLEHDSLTEDVECFTSLLADDAPRVSVLEIGSGTGRVAAALALAGHTVTGVEPSAAMRGRCERRLRELPEKVARRVTLLPGSATTFAPREGSRFDVALFALNAIAHLTTLEERHAALLRVRQHLAPEGRLLVDLDLLGPRRLRETAGQLWWQGTWPVPDSETLVSHFLTATPGGESDVVEVVHLYDVHAQGGELRRTLARMPLAVLTAGELALTLVHAGYALEASYGGYDLAPLDALSPRALLVARPAAGG